MASSLNEGRDRELRRVFNFLAGFAAKHKLREALQPRLERRAQLAACLRNRDAVAVRGAGGGAGGGGGGGGGAPAALTPALIEPEQRRLASEIASLQARIDRVDRGGGGGDAAGGSGGGASEPTQPPAERKITVRDLQQALAYLGKHADKKEVEDMIWEVDENLDGCVDYEEFALMFRRNLADATGLEPCQLFNVVQFCVYDKDFSSFISVDEALHMLYARHGKERLEAEMQALFGDVLSAEGTGRLCFVDYLAAIGKARPPSPRAASAAAAAAAKAADRRH